MPIIRILHNVSRSVAHDARLRAPELEALVTPLNSDSLCTPSRTPGACVSNQTTKAARRRAIQTTAQLT